MVPWGPIKFGPSETYRVLLWPEPLIQIRCDHCETINLDGGPGPKYLLKQCRDDTVRRMFGRDASMDMVHYEGTKSGLGLEDTKYWAIWAVKNTDRTANAINAFFTNSPTRVCWMSFADILNLETNPLALCSPALVICALRFAAFCVCVGSARMVTPPAVHCLTSRRTVPAQRFASWARRSGCTVRANAAV